MSHLVLSPVDPRPVNAVVIEGLSETFSVGLSSIKVSQIRITVCVFGSRLKLACSLEDYLIASLALYKNNTPPQGSLA